MDTITIYWVVAIFVIFVLFLMSVKKVNQQSVKIVQRFGKFKKVLYPGLNFIVPFVDSVAGELNLKLQQAEISVDAKTKDNVFIRIVLSVQYQIMKGKEQDAFYKLENPIKQIESFVFNIVRSEIPKLSLDEVFVNQDHIAQAVDEQLAATMEDFGYTIFKVLVTEVSPAANVVQAMNDVKASEQLKISTANRADAQKITTIKQAEAEKETKRLSGEGVAAERQAIVNGLKASVEELAEATGTKASEAMAMLMTTQYYDTLRAIGTADKSNTIMIPYGADGSDRIRDSILAANVASDKNP